MNNRTDWFYEAKFGLFVHWTTHSLPKEGEKKSHADAIKDFQIDTFVSQIVETQVGVNRQSFCFAFVHQGYA